MNTEMKTTYSGSDLDANKAKPFKRAEDYSAQKDKLVSEIKTVVADAEALLKTAASSTAEGLGAAYSQFEGKLQNVRSSLDQARTVVTEHSKEAMDVTNRYISTNPWKSVGMAAGVGIILGFLLSRR